MPDNLKVFKNLVSTTAATSNAAVPINIITNNSSTRAVVKDLQFRILENPNPNLAGVYKYPYVLKQNDYPITTVADSVGDQQVYTGTQIIDTNSTLTVEVQAEPVVQQFGGLELLMQLRGANYYTTLPIILPPAGSATPTATSIMQALDPQKAATLGRTQTSVASLSSESYTSACAIMINGVRHFVAANTGGNNIRILNTSNNLVQTINVGTLGLTIHAVAADNNFIYGHVASGNNVIHRWTIGTNPAVAFVKAANLSITDNVPGFPANNSGFFDHYNGNLYLRGSGGNSSAYIINTTTGAVSSVGIAGQTENMGGKVTVNASGTPFLVEHQDQDLVVWNLLNNNVTRYVSIYSTNPTTTTMRSVVVLAPGLVFFNNGTYGEQMIVDVNGIAANSSAGAVQTLTHSTFFQAGGSASTLMVSSLTGATATIARPVVYDMLCAGVEST
jgi:hypothetical protein